MRITVNAVFCKKVADLLMRLLCLQLCRWARLDVLEKFNESLIRSHAASFSYNTKRNDRLATCRSFRELLLAPHGQLPAYATLRRGMLVVILRRQRVPAYGSRLFAAARAAVDAGHRRRCVRLVDPVELGIG